MAVYTHLEREVVESILLQYGLEPLVEYCGIAEGVENTNYLIITKKRKLILTVYEKRMNVEEIPFFLDLMKFLNEKSINCPQPLRQENGEYTSVINGKTIALVSFLEGKSVKKIKDVHCKSVGKELALMHNATADFSQNRKNTMSISTWSTLFDQIESMLGSSELKNEMQSALESILSRWPEEGALPTGVIHADLFPDNVFFIQDKVSGFIDFYFACNDFYIHDLAIAINAWCFEGESAEFNMTKARKMLNAYNRHRELMAVELENLPIICAGAAMRFLLTRLYDALHPVDGAEVTVKNPTEYLNKLRFHLNTKHVGEYGFSF